MNFNPEWILNPLTAYAITGTGLLALLFLWLGARIEASKCRHDMTSMKELTDAALRELASKVDGLALQSQVPEQVQEFAVVPHSLNLTRRARAMHMRRRGDEPHTIAAALGISYGEVELLFKLDQIFQQKQ